MLPPPIYRLILNHQPANRFESSSNFMNETMKGEGGDCGVSAQTFITRCMYVVACVVQTPKHCHISTSQIKCFLINRVLGHKTLSQK